MKIVSLLFLELVIFLSLIGQVELIQAPELLGTEPAVALWFRTAHYEVGIIRAEWKDTGDRFLFLAWGEDGQGSIVQLAGPRMGQYGPYVHSTKWRFYYERQLVEAWSGRVEFRGKFRAFCGGEQLPNACRWK